MQGMWFIGVGRMLLVVFELLRRVRIAGSGAAELGVAVVNQTTCGRK